jgi:Uma2 family endonuclease
VAQPERLWPIEEPSIKPPPYTVDDLFELPDDGNRYEVLGGSLVVSAAPAPKHQYIADALCRELWRIRPAGVQVVTATAVRLRNGDGPIPDVVVTTADLWSSSRGLPVDEVHTVIEVVSPSNALIDRAYKREMYAETGIPCYWRVEIDPWRGHDGPYPLIVARLRGDSDWVTVEAAAGSETKLPLAVGRVEDGTIVVVEVALDPMTLLP